MNKTVELKVPQKIIDKYNLKLLVLFGSTDTEYMTKNSDLDLGYLSEELLDQESESNLLQELIRFYQRIDIDLVNLRKATPSLKFEVAKKGRVIFQLEGEFLKFQLYAARVFADTKHLRKLRKEVLDNKINAL
ncbi:MAG: type VII toxin-antitoxin system MntA family adenylyltransferase antitoxin [Bacillota bacterium]